MGADLAAISVYVRRAAGEAGLQAVVDYAADRGFGITAVPARRCVLLRGARDALRAAFDPVPSEFASRIEAVLGLEAHTEAAPVLRPGFATVSGTGEALGTLAASLGLPDGDGARHCIGLLSFGGGPDHAALAAACHSLHIAVPAPAAHLICVDAASPMPDVADWPLLAMLVVLAALAPKAKVVIYAAPPSLRGWVDALSAALHDHHNKPSVVCSGWLPPDPCPMAATLARQATALGIHLYQATADAGNNRLASPHTDRAWTGSAIDAVLQAASRLRAMPAAHAAPPAEPPPPRPNFDAITVTDKPLAVQHRMRIAYETDRYPGRPADGELSVPWVLLAGSIATDIAVGAEGSLWALSGLPTFRGFALFQLTALGWRAVAAGGMALAVDGEGMPWLVDASGALSRFNGTDWHVLRGGVHDIAVAPDGAAWALSSSRSATGRAVLHRPAPSGAEWIELGMHAERITVAPDGTPWIVTMAGEAMRYHADAWVIEASNVHDIAVDEHGRVWVVSRTGRRLYCRARSDGGWVRGDGVADRVVAQHGGMLWAVTPHGCVAAAKVAAA
jgi:hypothetical protein